MTELHVLVNLILSMVNQSSSRHQLLELLQEQLSPLSGEIISQKLGISRVAIWKQIGKLGEMGYVIDTSRKGYQLIEEPPDALQPHLFDRPEHFYCLGETDSTMDYTERLLQKKEDRGDFIVTAEKQTAGRGRNHREWISNSGGLFFTHSFPSDQSTPLSYQTSMAALISLTEILTDDYNQPASIKWPNDILISGKKVIGLLAASRTENERVSRYNLGIGINVNNAPPLPESTCSLSRLTGKNLSRSELMKKYLQRMGAYNGDRDAVLTERFTSLCSWNDSVSIQLMNGDIVSGELKELTHEGALVLSGGHRIYPGDCQKRIK